MATLSTHLRAVLLCQMFACHWVTSTSLASRMIPNWWVTARERGSCYESSDCASNECCAQPIGSQLRHCLRLRNMGEPCRINPYLLDEDNAVYLDICPCATGLTCTSLYEGVLGFSCRDIVPKQRAASKQSRRRSRDFEYLRANFYKAIVQALRKTSKTGS